MRNAECKMLNLGFSRRGDRSPVGCAEVNRNDGCADKLRQALSFGEGGCPQGRRERCEQISLSLQGVMYFLSSDKKYQKAELRGAAP